MTIRGDEASEASTSHWTRPSADETFLGLAKVWRTRSTCIRGQVGCVIVNVDGYVLTSGYNGAPRGMPHCYEVGCLMDGGHCVRAIHAEMNAIVQAAREGISLVGAMLYTTKRPCLRCSVALIQAGISRVIYVEDYETDDAETAIAMLTYAGISTRRAE